MDNQLFEVEKNNIFAETQKLIEAIRVEYGLYAAYWRYTYEHEKWKFFLATQKFDYRSALQYEEYKRLCQLINQLDLQYIEVSDLHFISPKSVFVQNLAERVYRSHLAIPKAQKPIRFEGAILGKELIVDCFLFFIEKPIWSSTELEFHLHQPHFAR